MVLQFIILGTNIFGYFNKKYDKNHVFKKTLNIDVK